MMPNNMSSGTATPVGGRTVNAAALASSAGRTTARPEGGVSLVNGFQSMSVNDSNVHASNWSDPVSPAYDTRSPGQSFGRGQAGNMHPTATPFRPQQTSANGNGAALHTPMSMLARDSMPDFAQPTIVQSVPARHDSKPINDSKFGGESQVIGAGSHSSSPASVKSGIFTTAVNANSSHFIKLYKIDAASFDVVMKTLSEKFEWKAKVLQQASLPADGGNKMTVYLCFNSLDAAARAFQEVSIVSRDKWDVKYVEHAEYANAAARLQMHPDEVISKYASQVLFVAQLDDDARNINFTRVKNHAWALASDFGTILAWEVNDSGDGSLQFLAEYREIRIAWLALETTSKDPVSHSGYTISAVPVLGPNPTYDIGHDGTLVPFTDGNEPATPHRPFDGAGVLQTSPSGRTSWKVLPDGTTVPAASAFTIPKLTVTPPSNMADVQIRQRYSEPAPQNHYYENDPLYEAPRNHSWAHTMTCPRYANTPTEPQCVQIQRIASGEDVRTTIMLRNIPNKWGVYEWKQMLDEVTAGLYDFSYLRIDFQNTCNVGYGFVNFIDAKCITKFMNHWEGKEWQPGLHPQKIAMLSYATVQGLDCLVEKFRNSSIMEEFINYRPKLWYTKNDNVPDYMIGTEKKFPGPNNYSKQQRSRDNAAQIGLYAPRSGQRGHDRARRSNYDRGTTLQLQEESYWRAQQPATYFNPNFGFQQQHNYVAAGGPGPVGGPVNGFHPGFYPNYPLPGMPPYAMPQPYAPYYPAQQGYHAIGPGFGNGFGGYQPRNAASMSRTLSGGRLAGGRPKNVTVADPRQYDPVVPRSHQAGGYDAASPTATTGGYGYQYGQQC